MSLNRFAKRRDANEGPLIAAARQFGAQVEVAGPLDFWVGWRHGWFPVEVKTEKGKYTPEQILFIARCKERGNPVHTWRTPMDVFESLGAKQTA